MQFQLYHETNTMMLIMLIIEICYAFGLVYVGSEVGEQLSGSFDKISNVIDQFNWYLLPIGVQKMLPTIILTTKQPVVFKCFGGILCNRDVFKKVNSTEQISQIQVETRG